MNTQRRVNEHSPGRRNPHLCWRVSTIIGVLLAGAFTLPLPSLSADPQTQNPKSTVSAKAPVPSDEITKADTYGGPVQSGPSMNLAIGKSALLRLPKAIHRISIGNAAIADVAIISPRELYLIGKAAGSTNVVLWHTARAITVFDVSINVDAGRLEARLRELLPEEDDIAVNAAAETVVLTGTVSSSETSRYAGRIAEAYVYNLDSAAPAPANADLVEGEANADLGQGGRSGAATARARPRVVNMLRVSPPHVMLDVRMAEVSKSVTRHLESELRIPLSNSDWSYTILDSALADGGELLAAIKSNIMAVDGEKPDDPIRILANPRIIAVSGQEGSFLAGGKIFLPVERTNATTGSSTVAFEEKEFGVGLKLTPMVRQGGRINLSVSPEISELSQSGSSVTLEGKTTRLPSLATRRAHATVELNDGQGLAIAGWIDRRFTDTIKRLPALGEVPILGALLRSKQFQAGDSELLLVVTPRIMKRSSPEHASSNDRSIPPSSGELSTGGRTESDAPKKDTGDQIRHAAASVKGGFEVK